MESGTRDAAGPMALLEMIHSGWMSQAIHVAARLGIADVLAHGPVTSAELAGCVGAHADSLFRLLRALTTLGLCAERDDGAFELTPLGSHLRAAGEPSVRAVALHWGGSMWPIWGTLLHSVKTGQSPRALVTRKESFESLAQDVLNRRPLRGPHPAPPMCIFAGRLSSPLCQAFEARFGVALRQMYGTTETLTVTADFAPSTGVRSETAGRPLPGVAVRIGDDPHAPYVPGAPGKIWVHSPWAMEGYGFPPHVEREGIVDGWWPSPDIGRLDEDGSLTLQGRLDDWIRTGAGHAVNPAEIAAALERYPGVTDIAVVPLEAAAGPMLGVLVQSSERLAPGELRSHLARALPPWARPRVLDTIRELPRLPGGRTDRRACIEILTKALRRVDAQ